MEFRKPSKWFESLIIRGLKNRKRSFQTGK
jgi:hypothetical protein